MRRRRNQLTALCVGAAATTVLALAGPATAAPAGPTPTEGTIRNADTAGAVKGRYIVALEGRPSVRAGAEADVRADARGLAQRYGAQVRQVYSAAFRGFSISATETQAKRLAAADGVAYVEADGTARLVGTQPNPPSYGIDRVDGALDSAYTYPNTGSGVTAYVIDTGVDMDHPNFEGRASSGYDFSDNDPDASDCQGHGTHVSGTVGSRDYGIAKDVGVVSVRVLNCQGTAPWSTVIDGMDWVARNASGPSVANMSIGGDPNSSVDQAVQGLVDAGVTTVIAAGNNNRDACDYSPSRTAAAITVGATTSSDTRSSFSNYGRCLDLFAPGSDIVSTRNGGGQTTMNGTSMASPHVAGAAALYLSAHRGAAPREVRDALVNGADQGEVGNPGSGSPNLLLNVSGLGGDDEPTPGEPTASFTADCSATEPTCAFDASGSTDPDGDIASYAWDFGDEKTGTGADPSHTYASVGTYEVTLTVTDDAGHSDTATRTVRVGAPPAGDTPSASFTAFCMQTGCDFDASGTTDPDDDIASYAWSFGDGQNGSGVTTSHRYPAAQQNFTASLTVTDDAGHSDTATRTIQCWSFGFCFAN
ncbi:S8 family serine peptidase [Streptomyces sp. NBC_00334]|uniref:S8 family serine peptidase n=1 Tax=Streptomyces sp. NBC_00334 TaxID=2975713 RepID=UPI002E29CE14|nr:S8 family serine peptidase [Streptomyces sp. NBC_00334]